MALGLLLVLGGTSAQGQSVSRGDGVGNPSNRGGGHRGGGFRGSGLAGALIGVGAGLIAEGARARAERDEVEIVDEEVEWPQRRPDRRAKAGKPPSKPEIRAEPRRKPAAEPTARIARKTAAKGHQDKRVQDGVRTAKARDDRGGSAGGPPRGAVPAAAASAPAAIAVAPSQARAPGEVLCEIRSGVSEEQIRALGRGQRLERLSAECFELTGATVIRYRIRDGRSVDAAATSLAADPRVVSAQPNHFYTLSAEVGAAMASTQYAVAKLRLGEAHQVATGADVAIAVIDSGVDAAHPALKGAVAESFDPVGGTFRPHAHGTAVAGLAAARGDLTSPAPGARILAIRAFAPDQPAKPGAQGTTMHILKGLDWAAKRGAKVVNMSFAGPKDAKISEFIAAGAARGAIHVAAAGNAGPSSPPLYPAADPNVIAVTATDAEDGLLPAANRGAHLSVAAPGVEVLVAAPGAKFAYMSGTSMASAGVAGVVALMAQAKPGLAAWQARAALTTTAHDLGAPGADVEFGAGAADAKAALDAVAPPVAVSSGPAPEAVGQTRAPTDASAIAQAQ